MVEPPEQDRKGASPRIINRLCRRAATRRRAGTKAMHTMKKIVLTVLVSGLFVCARAQDIESILQQVEQNNKELQAIRRGNEVSELEIRGRNTLEDPSVEYSPFYVKGNDGMASSELVVSQVFDFPTLYVARHRAGKLQEEVLDLQYQASRRDILLEAKNRCLDLVYQNRLLSLLELRRKNAGELLTLFTRKLEAGDATQLEVNKIKMDRMNIRTETAQVETARQTILQELLALNGNVPLTGEPVEYGAEPSVADCEALYARAVASDYDLRTARASELAAAQEVKVSRQNWIPKLAVGYRRNTELKEARNGFLVGATFPLFSSRRKVRMARAQHAGMQLQLENTRLQTETRVRARIHELQMLGKTVEAYDVELMYHTLDLLRKAVESGEISVIDYYVEADGIYRNLQTRMELERQYQGVVAELLKNEL